MNATDTAASFQNAINRSRELDSDLMRTSRVAPGRYSVLGEHNWYEVVVTRDGYACTCEGAQHGRPACWHRASAFRMRLACRSLKASTPTPALTPGQQAKRDLWG